MSEDKNIKNSKSAIDLSRRRLAKASLVAVPLLSTLPGKSAFARNDCTVSGNLSGNMSGDPADDICVTKYAGKSPQTWLGFISPSDTRLFQDVFCSSFGLCPLPASPTLSGKTFYDVLHDYVDDINNTGVSSIEVEAHMVAAYLNAAFFSSLQFPYTEADIVDIYGDYLTSAISEATLLEVFRLLNVN